MERKTDRRNWAVRPLTEADMEPYLDKFRFRSLSDPQIWNSAVTNGIFVRFCDVELSHDELLSMAEQEHHKKGGKQYE